MARKALFVRQAQQVAVRDAELPGPPRGRRRPAWGRFCSLVTPFLHAMQRQKSGATLPAGGWGAVGGSALIRGMPGCDGLGAEGGGCGTHARDGADLSGVSHLVAFGILTYRDAALEGNAAVQRQSGKVVFCNNLRRYRLRRELADYMLKRRRA